MSTKSHHAFKGRQRDGWHGRRLPPESASGFAACSPGGVRAFVVFLRSARKERRRFSDACGHLSASQRTVVDDSLFLGDAVAGRGRMQFSNKSSLLNKTRQAHSYGDCSLSVGSFSVRVAFCNRRASRRLLAELPLTALNDSDVHIVYTQWRIVCGISL